MTQASTKGWIPLGIVVLAAIAGCGNDDASPRQKQAQYLDAQLAEVSSELAFMDFQLKVNAEAHCAVADALSNTLETSSDQDATKVLMHDLSQEAQGRCAAYKTTLSASLPVVQLAKETGRIPSPIYSFIIVEEEDKTYQEEEVGPFASESVCIEIENIARKAGLATKACKVWKTSRLRRTSPAPFTPNIRFK